MDLRIRWSISAKKAVEILEGIMLNLYINLEMIIISILVSAPIHEHGMYFHLLRSSFIPFSNVADITVPVCTSLVKCILMYFILDFLFRIVFLISFLDGSWSADVCVLILYPATWLNLFVGSYMFFQFFRISLHRIMSFMTRDNFT